MNFHVFLLVFLLIFSLTLLCALCWSHPGPAPSRTAASVRARLPRLRHRPAAQTTAPPVV